MHKLKIIIVSLLIGVCFGRLYSQAPIKQLYNQSNELFLKGDYAGALNCNIKALKLTEETDNKDLIAYAYTQVAKMYYYLNDRRLALNYFLKAKTIIEANQIDSLKTNVVGNIGAIYTELGKIDSALFYLNETLKQMHKKQDITGLARLNSIVADLHLNHTHNYELAKKSIIESEFYADKSENKDVKAFVKIKYSLYYRYTNNYSKSIEYAKTALHIYEEMGRIDGQIYALKVLADVLALDGNKEAQKVYTRVFVLKDSVFKVETANKIADYKIQYETEKKVTENTLLQKENDLKQSKIDSRNKTIIGLLIGVLLIVIVVFWQISVQKLKKKNLELETSQAMQKEKERISRDLHDNVGGQLSYVLYSLDGVNSESNEKRTELITNINESVRNVISNLRETIWAINDESISITDFSDKLKVYARAMFRNTDTKISYSENITSDVSLNSLVGLNLYRICQEIINNAFKYSSAKEFKIQLTVTNSIALIISDNGVGFDIEKKSDNGFGLSNIKARAEEIGITLNLKAELKKGVTYTILV